MSGEGTRAIAARVRHHIVDMCALPEGGHLGGALSLADILTVLYFKVLRVDPADPRRPGRDILLLSKGHGALCLYAVLAERGFFPVAELASYGVQPGRLMGHPSAAVPGVELPTGSLGHGLALGVGTALAARLDASPARSFVIIGDGELQEGSCWEAAMTAASLRTDNLVAVVDRNGLQLGSATQEISPVQSLSARWHQFGWAVREVDGHAHDQLAGALCEPGPPGRPLVVIANTVKGNGVPFAAGLVKSHYASLSPRAQARAHFELDRFERARAGGDVTVPP